MARIWLATIVSLVFGNIASAQWMPQHGGVKDRLRGLGVVSRDVAWASGAGGAFLRTTDGGKAWAALIVPGASGLDFRDLHAVDAGTAYLLSIGEGEKSRILKTTDGGANWALQHTNRDPKGFLDAIAFWDDHHGLALGDPVDGRFMVLATDDGGKTWTRIPAGGIPPALPGEGAFAASGTCLVVSGDGQAWFGTGGAKVSRVFRSTNRGRTWTAQETPVRAGTPSSGIFSLAFWDAAHGVAVGGDYKDPDAPGVLVARTKDGGLTWTASRGTRPGGYRSGVAFVPGTRGPTLVAVGPSGTDVSSDGGEGWRPLGKDGFDAVGFASKDAGWAVGEGGRVARFAGELPGAP